MNRDAGPFRVAQNTFWVALAAWLAAAEVKAQSAMIHAAKAGSALCASVALCSLLATSASAQTNRPAEPLKSLRDYTGIWGPSAADCEAKLSGRLDQEGVDRATATKHLLIGICDHGLDVLYQPVYCRGSRIMRRADSVEFLAACRVKDYPEKRFQIKIMLRAPDAISFNEKDFPADYFWLSGDYQRCNRAYTCERR
jgi:hypothetical protein